jgi:hypothetical protein
MNSSRAVLFTAKQPGSTAAGFPPLKWVMIDVSSAPAPHEKVMIFHAARVFNPDTACLGTEIPWSTTNQLL